MRKQRADKDGEKEPAKEVVKKEMKDGDKEEGKEARLLLKVLEL